MTVKIHISKEIAELAVGQSIIYDEPPTSKQKFIDCVRWYVLQYGFSSADDHQRENSVAGVDEQVDKIVSKYWR